LIFPQVVVNVHGGAHFYSIMSFLTNQTVVWCLITFLVEVTFTMWILKLTSLTQGKGL